MINDLRYAIRMLVKNPGFTAVAVITLALGIGANTAIFSLVNAVLLRPLPYQDPERLVKMRELDKYSGVAGASAPDLVDWREQSQSFVQMAAFEWRDFNLADGYEPLRLHGFRVEPNFFKLLGIEALLGRTFLPEEGQLGKGRVVVISHGLWQRHFGADPDLL